ncbi:hypothetical protein ACFLTE_06200 [Bacteroidota bacterium]
MQTIIKIILLILLTIIVIFTGCNSNTLIEAEKEFVVKDTSKVTTIIIKNSNSEIILKKYNNVWKVNSYIANKDYVNYLLKILNRIQIHSKIASDKTNSVKNIIDSAFVEIIIYKNRKIINNYIVSPHPVNEFCYALSKNNNQVYSLFIPGYEYSLFPIFNTSVSHWRNKTLIGLFPGEIKSIALENNFHHDYSFKINVKGKREYELEHLTSKNKKVHNINTEKIERYISYFNQVEFTSQIERRVNYIYDSLQQKKPGYNIIINTEDSFIQLKTYPIFIKDQVNILGDSINIDPDNLFATTNIDSNVYLMKYTDIDPIIKKLEYFITP